MGIILDLNGRILNNLYLFSSVDNAKEEREKDFKYYCKDCDYGTFSKDQYETHNNKKHTI